MSFRFDAHTQGGEERYKCSYPIGLDPYRGGCGNDCLYCYVRHANLDRGGWHPDDPNVLDVAHLRKLFVSVFDKRRSNGRAKQALATRVPLRIGMNTDPFQKAEREHAATARTLEILKDFRCPYVLLTKNAMVAEDTYLDLYDPEISYLEITITTLNKALGQTIERGASPPVERLRALRELQRAGFKTAARINPLFPIYEDSHFTDKKNSDCLPKLDYFSWELVHRICECKPTTLIAGFLRLDSVKTHRWLQKQAGLDLMPYFWKHPRHKYYSPEEVGYYYEESRRICDQYGVAFTVCYDCDSNYDRFKHMWANKEDCCNALGQSKYFDKTYRMVARKIEK